MYLFYKCSCGGPLLLEQFPLDGLGLLLPFDGEVLFGLLFLLVVLDGEDLDVLAGLAFAQLPLELGRQFLQLDLPFFLEAVVDFLFLAVTLLQKLAIEPVLLGSVLFLQPDLFITVLSIQ